MPSYFVATLISQINLYLSLRKGVTFGLDVRHAQVERKSPVVKNRKESRKPGIIKI